MQKTILFIALAVIIAFSPACKNSTKEKNIEDDIRKAVKNNPGINAGSNTFSIEAPAGWTIKDTSLMGMKYTFLSSELENNSDNFKENVNIVTERCGSMGLDDYYSASLTGLKTMPGFERGKESDRSINNIEFKNLKYSHSYGGMPIDVDVYFTIRDGLAYIITCSAKKGEMDKWETQFREAVSSFSFK